MIICKEVYIMKKMLCWLLTVAMLLSVCSAAVMSAAALTDFDGYQLIYDYKDLQRVNNDLSGKYKLMRDIDMSPLTNKYAWYANVGSWSYIGSASEPFTGEFDGNGYEIQNMDINLGYEANENEDRYFGLFARNEGVIRNVKVVGNLNGSSLSANTYAGGICAFNNGLLEDCCHVGTINFNGCATKKFVGYIGGIAGKNGESGVMKECFQAGDVLANDEGILDYYYRASPLYCGGITTGGGTFTHCYVTGKVYGSYQEGAKDDVALYDAFCYLDKGRKITYEQCYIHYTQYQSFGIRDKNSVQGFPAEQMKLLSSYTDWDFKNVWLLDNQCEYPFPQLRNCLQIKGAVHREQALPHSEDGFIEVRDLADLVYIDTNLDKKYKLMNDIDIAQEMEQGKVAWYKKDDSWKPLGKSQKQAFTGEFDGNGHSITGLNYSFPDELSDTYGGLFYDNEGLIKNLKVSSRLRIGTAVNGEVLTFGSIAVFNNGTIEGCNIDIEAKANLSLYCEDWADGDYGANSKYGTGTYIVGGVTSNNKGTVKRCCTTGELICKRINNRSYYEDEIYGGGIYYHGFECMHTVKFYAITTGGTVENCYNTAQAPGFIGVSYNPRTTITHCYNAGVIGEGDEKSDDCFIMERPEDGDTEKKVLSKSEMQQQSSFTGYDFDNIWYFDTADGYRYPKLRAVTTDLPTPELTGIRVTSLPDRITYFEGEAFDPAGMTVTASYDICDPQTVTDYTYSGYNSTVGKKTIKVQYKGFTDSFEVEVLEDPLKITSISVVVPPTKTEYYQNEKLDTTGMVVAAVTKNGEIKQVNAYTVSEMTGETGEQVITVTFQGHTATFKVKVLEGKVPVKKGDLSGDGVINGADAGIFNRYISGWEGYADKIADLSAADLNGDGKVNGADAGILNRYVSGWEGYDKYFK